jgi:hypothetical protein
MSAVDPQAGSPPPTDPPKPRKPRRPRDESEVFGSFTPWKNPAAVYGYYVSLAALTPALGLALGPIAILLGIIGLVHRGLRPNVLGGNFALAAILLGTLNTLLNAAGWWCVGRGLGWW